MRSTRNHPAPDRTLMRAVATGLVVGLATTALLGFGGAKFSTAQAADTANSSVTVKATDQDPDAKNAPLPDLAVTVSQTENLMSQGVLVSWTGGIHSTVPSGDSNGGANFLQIAQCWGDDPLNPGQPDRTTCQYGAFRSAGSARDNFVSSDAVVAPEDVQFTSPEAGPFDPTYTSIPFRSATGKTISSIGENHEKLDVDVNTNEFFTQYTSNEVKWAGSGSAGTGATRFEVQTALQSPGLGCGAPEAKPDGTTAPRSCWLVVIPRGTADPGVSSITKSGLFWSSWKHRIAVKLDFKPIGLTCPIGSAERQVAGSELVAGAVASWQPTLCGSTGGAVYTISKGAESDALQTSLTQQSAPLALTTRASSSELTDSLAYAPVALTGLSIGFAIDRQPDPGEGTPESVTEQTGTSFSEIKLTPRLIAKLLTNSYLDSLPTFADKTHLGFTSTADAGHNARNLVLDPDFRAINDPEWDYESLISPSLADLLVPQGRSDAAWQLWRYVLSDPEAVDFLAGKADPWEMVVNPWTTTDAEANLSESAFVVPREDFPKADPAEQAGGNDGSLPINVVSWRPYTNDLDQAGYLTLRGDGQVLGLWDPTSSPAKYTKSPRNLPGQQRVLSLTDTASAARYQVVSASLQNASGSFVAPTTESLTAAAAAMTPVVGQSQVYEYDPAGAAAVAAPTAYPLAMPVYAAANPRSTDATARADYATFIRYAVTEGQKPGTDPGTLPAGYAPIPPGWRDQALAAANVIQSGGAVVTPSNPAVAPPVASGSAAVPASPSSNVSAPAAAAPAAGPSASGSTAAVLGNETPADPDTGGLAAAIPVGGMSGLAAAAAVPLLSRIRRKSL
ncbi:hypothetical protein GCM10022381_27570 [Leifsonia kafniensis]|uniref:PBP domain-containing protein n=1 Tax=Leifsonia kafniensis TaxID=475957 RepID=A0ABP7KPK3_9MICO